MTEHASRQDQTIILEKYKYNFKHNTATKLCQKNLQSECVCVIGKVLYIKFAPHLGLLICVYALGALGK